MSSTSERRRPATAVAAALVALALAGFFTLLTVLTMGPLAHLDVALNEPRSLAPWRDELLVVDRIGQRAVCLPLLVVVAAFVAYRVRDWRPITVAAVSVVALNLVVLVVKLGLGREGPRLDDPTFFTGGDMYPSGHTANVVLVYGLMAFLLLRYRVAPGRAMRPMSIVVMALSVIMVATSLALRWHWFTDLVAGLFAGAAVLAFTVAIDTAIPWHPRLREPAGRSAEPRTPVGAEPR